MAYEQVAARIESLVERRALLPGGKLPSLREMRRRTGYSITTIMQGYELLEGRGLIEARPRSGWFVAPRVELPALPPRPARLPKRKIDAFVQVSFERALGESDVVQLTEAVPSAELLPSRNLLRIVARLCRRNDPKLLQFEPPQGNVALREALARRASTGGMDVGAGDIVTTNGGMESLNLCLRTVARAGSRILVLGPSYFGYLEVIASLGMKAVEVMPDARGISVTTLRPMLRQHRFDAALVLPNLRTPWGPTLHDPEAVLALLARHGTPLIEDDIYGDLFLGASRATPLKALDRKEMVLHCASFSKYVSPGFRISWVAPGRFRERFLRMKFLSSLATGTLPQLALGEYLATGGYDRHLRRTRKQLLNQLSAYASFITETFPRGTVPVPPAAGFALWVQLPGKLSANRIFHEALERGIATAPGEVFTKTGALDRFLRVSFAHPWSSRIHEALHTLAEVTSQKSEERMARVPR